MSQVLTRDELRALVGGWIGRGAVVAGPAKVADTVQYQRLAEPGQLLLDGFVRPANSIKEFVFPRHEKLYGYRLEGNRVELFELPRFADEQIIVAARPCDAAALPILDHVFNWEPADELYAARRERTAVITLACKSHDSDCFCTAVGLGPDATGGSDAMLFELDAGGYEVRCLTPRGEALFAGVGRQSDVVGSVPPGPTPEMDLGVVRALLKENFDNPLWAELSLRCIGCGACTYSCPTCHCFDIADEKVGKVGHRVRNWDACQFGLFTLHASGHNPRPLQPQRQRQRIYHKFRMFPGRFGDLLCTGCGNCTRVCPVSLGVANVLKSLEQSVTLEICEVDDV